MRCGCRRVTDPSQRDQKNNTYQPESHDQCSSCFNLRQSCGEEHKRSCDQAETKLPDSTELRSNQNRPPRRCREGTPERQATHARNLEPKPEESGKKRGDKAPKSQAEQ